MLTPDHLQHPLKRGYLIAIEGPDGVGKATQSDLLVKHLRSVGQEAVLHSYPRYQAGITGEMLAFALHKLESKPNFNFLELDPILASYYYALDRAYHSPEIKGLLANGTTVVTDRYTFSNIIHQTAKIETEGSSGQQNQTNPEDNEPEDRLTTFQKQLHFARRILDLEFNQFGIPKPDLTIYLNLPEGLQRRLINQRGNSDLTDRDEAHQAASNRIGHELSCMNGVKAVVIDCQTFDGKDIKPEEVIASDIATVISTRLSIPKHPEKGFHIHPRHRHIERRF
jgi:dTMP kinase